MNDTAIALIIIIGASVFVGMGLAVAIVQTLQRVLRRERRNWPERIRQDYETERIRDHFFDHLTPADVVELVAAGWKPPAPVAARWREVARMRRISTMTPAELDCLEKARAAGIHVDAHPDDLVFDPFYNPYNEK